MLTLYRVYVKATWFTCLSLYQVPYYGFVCFCQTPRKILKYNIRPSIHLCMLLQPLLGPDLPTQKHIHSSLVPSETSLWCSWHRTFYEVRLFVMWVISLDLSGMEDPASSYATVDRALRIPWPCKPHHITVGMPLGGQYRTTHSNSVPTLHP